MPVAVAVVRFAVEQRHQHPGRSAGTISEVEGLFGKYFGVGLGVFHGFVDPHCRRAL